MTDYTQNVSYGPKDALSTGDAAKRIKGTELDAEFAEIATAIASKEDEANKGANNGYCGLGAGGLVDPTDLPASTESAQGAVELATTAEVTTGTDTTRAVTAAGVKAAIDALKAAGLTLTGGTLVVEGTIVSFRLTETDAATDEKTWEWRASGGDLFLYTNNDGGSAVGTPMAFTRNGTTVTEAAITATSVKANGSEVLTAATGAAIATSGSFSMELASASSGGTTYATDTAYWRKIGDVVTLTLPDTFSVAALDEATYVFVRGLPAAIRSACAVQQTVAVPITNAGYIDHGALEVFTGSVDYMRIYPAGSIGWEISPGSVCGLYAGATITYRVAD